nr:alpha/beta hydrolase [Catelliglobosispora koreensis]
MEDAELRHELLNSIETPDGRRLTMEVTGHPNGSPVFLLHGTPGSRNGPKPRAAILYRSEIRLITYDRPGYGGSTRQESRRVADAAADVATIADALGLDRFSVVGRSGGGPHALACAASMPDRVTRAAALVCLAPANAEGLNWFEGMSDDNVSAYETAEADASRFAERIRLRAERILRDPESLIRLLLGQMPEVDRRIVQSTAMRKHLVSTYREAVRPGPYGWIDDALAFRQEWGFDLSSITVPVLLWHGTADTFSPLSHTLWLAKRLPQSEVWLEQNKAHFGAMEVLPDVFPWLTAQQKPLSSPV